MGIVKNPEKLERERDSWLGRERKRVIAEKKGRESDEKDDR